MGGLLVVLGLDGWYWWSVLEYSPVGIAHQGLVYLLVYGALNGLVFLTAFVVLGRWIRRARHAQEPIPPMALLTLHFWLYLALLLILFPYIGELP
ncbi:MAG: hypothetical protein HYV02_07320 [Deltaproteobacteria bacterium]|nr:hypothetical protein [Deltaproteobacteria bacterium]